MRADSLVVELIDICNLNCAYCLRDEAALHGKAHALPISTLVQLLADLRPGTVSCEVQFTGGEPTLHPEFRLALKAVHDAGFKFALITNGWTFARVLPWILEFRSSLSAVLFSVDGTSREEHDRIRGKGSFQRVMKAVLACRQHELPFSFKVTIDRRKALHLDGFVQFAARLGAASLQLAPLLPTDAVNAQDTLPIAAQREFLREVSLLRSTTRLALDLAAGFYDPRAEPTCGPLLERTLNVDYKGRLVLCTILAGFRGQREETDVVGRLDESALATLLPTLTDTIATRNEERTSAFRELRPRDQPSMRLGSNCLDCLCSFGKIDPGSLEDSLEIRSMDDNLSFRVPDAIISSEFNGTQGLLLDTRTQRYHTLNETATFLWLAVEQGRTVVQMADALCKEFAVDVARARESVEAAMVRFESQSLVEADTPPAPRTLEDESEARS